MPRHLSRFTVSFLLLFHLCVLHAEAASRKPVRGTQGMVVSSDSLASAAGIAILQAGGTAVDAAVAVGFTLAVTFPEAGNIGGGGFMLLRLADGTTTVLDFRETAPAAASRDMYLGPDGEPVPGKSTRGPLAAGVPGTVAGLLRVLEKYGTMNRSRVLQRPIELAERGFRVNARLAASLEEHGPAFAGFPASVRQFYRDGSPYREGELLHQPDLARTLRAIRDRGTDGFYRGPVADSLVATMERHGGIMTHQDLSSYEVVERDPLSGSYRGYEVITAPPPASGVILLQILNMLESFDLQAAGSLSSRSAHLLAAVAQRAYADRAEYLGDPDHVRVPVEELLERSYAENRASTIDSLRATPSVEVPAGIVAAPEDHHTSHYCVTDRFGNVASVTVTLNDSYGCKTVVAGAGFLLNNEMDDFVAKPGRPNLYGLVGNEANAIAPGKRMVSSMAPSIVMRDDLPYIVLGGRGGSRITTAVAQVIVNIIDHGMDTQEAVDAPRVHHQWLPDRLFYEPRGLAADVMLALQQMGYVLEQSNVPNGRVHAILLENDWFFGGADARDEGVALGY